MKRGDDLPLDTVVVRAENAADGAESRAED